MTETAAAPTVASNGWRPDPMSERIVVRCYRSYRDAKRAVDRLAVARIPPTRITVMGRGFRWREMFTAGRVGKASTVAGAVVVAVSALVLWLTGGLDGSFSWLEAMAAGSVLGGGLGGVLGTAAWLAARRKRSVPETGHVDVDHDNFLVEAAYADRARALLDG